MQNAASDGCRAQMTVYYGGGPQRASRDGVRWPGNNIVYEAVGTEEVVDRFFLDLGTLEGDFEQRRSKAAQILCVYLLAKQRPQRSRLTSRQGVPLTNHTFPALNPVHEGAPPPFAT